jgi:hypothetical protein
MWQVHVDLRQLLLVLHSWIKLCSSAACLCSSYLAQKCLPQQCTVQWYVQALCPCPASVPQAAASFLANTTAAYHSIYDAVLKGVQSCSVTPPDV